MTRAEIAEKLEEIFHKVRAQKTELVVTEDSRLVDDLYLDSLERVEMLFEIESTFAISVTDEEALKFVTVRDIVDLVSARQG